MINSTLYAVLTMLDTIHTEMGDTTTTEVAVAFITILILFFYLQY